MTGLTCLREARTAAGMDLATAGGLIGKNASHLSKIERGKVRLAAEDAVVLARAYGVTVESMFGVVTS